MENRVEVKKAIQSAKAFYTETTNTVTDSILKIIENIDKYIYSHFSLSKMVITSVLIFALVFLRFKSCIQLGYFRYDDFDILFTTRLPILKQLLSLHADHTLPLYRLESYVMKMLFGVHPVPYNICNLFIHSLLLIIVFHLYRQLRYSIISYFIFLILYLGWTNWGETVTGYYILSIYVQITLFAILSLILHIKWRHSKSHFLLLMQFVVLLSSLFIDIAGVLLPAYLVVVSICFSLQDYKVITYKIIKDNIAIFKLCAFSYILFGTYNYYCYYVITHGKLLSMGSYKHSIYSALYQLYYFIAGGLALAPFYPIGYNELNPKVLSIVLAMSATALGSILFLHYSKSNLKYKFHFILFSIFILTASVLVVIGRPLPGSAYYWQTKYVGMPYTWTCLLLGSMYDRWWSSGSLRKEKFHILLLTLTVSTAYIVNQNWFSENYASKNRIVPIGYDAHLRDAVNRKVYIAEIGNILTTKLNLNSTTKKSIPNLDGYFIFSKHPILYHHYDLSHYADVLSLDSKITLYKNNAMQITSLNQVRIVDDLRKYVDPQFIEALKHDDDVRAFYLQPVSLRKRLKIRTLNAAKVDIRQIGNPANAFYGTTGDLSVTSNGNTTILLSDEQYDPIKKHIINFKIKLYSTNCKDTPVIGIEYLSDFSTSHILHKIPIHDNVNNEISIDMLQVYSYSLSSHVSDLNLKLITPGIYDVIGAEIK